VRATALFFRRSIAVYSVKSVFQGVGIGCGQGGYPNFKRHSMAIDPKTLDWSKVRKFSEQLAGDIAVVMHGAMS